MSDIKERLAKLSGTQRAQLMRKLTGQQNSLRAVEDRSDLPLSFSQQRLWFLNQFEPGGTNYNIPRAYRIRGPLDIDALCRSFNEIVHRHESLRTTFSMHNDAPVQIVTSELEIEIPLLEADDDAALHKLIMTEANRPFDLQQGPLIRANIIRLSDQDHVLLFNQHHIASDGWSLSIFLKELKLLYAAFVKGETSPLTDISLQYADFAVWQRGQQDEVLAKHLDYWKRTLFEVPVLELPTDRPRPAVQGYRGALHYWEVSSSLTYKLKALAQQERATLFMLLLAVFQILIYRYSNQEDFAVGSPIAGRSRPELEGIIGFFANTLVLRADLRGAPSFRQVLDRARQTSLEAFTHQEVPFEKLVEELLPQRDMSRNPLFQVMFALQNTPPARLALIGAEVEAIPIFVETEKFDLSLSITENADHLECIFTYNTDLFEHHTIERMAEHLQNLLQSVDTDPDRTISLLPLLSEQERHVLLMQWNKTECNYPSDKTIPDLFEQQARATPDAVALVFENRQLRYGELNSRANQIAHFLIARGVKLERPVALLMNRSLELLICILAILKAGGAYVPLDPKHPRERLKTIIDDAAPKLLLISGKHLAMASDIFSGQISQIETLQSELITSASHDPNVPRKPDHLAYILYTSGSTGIPKGVMIQHGSVVNLTYALQKQVFDKIDKRPMRVALNTAITFDASVQQWSRLLWGDCIVILPEDVSADAKALSSALRREHVDVLGCTPSQLRLLFEEGLFDLEGNCPVVVLCGGEAIDPALWSRASTNAHSRFYNVYGPTECTVDATCCRIEPRLHSPSIGRPLANVKAYILDQNRNPLPIGITGELWLGGAGVARGYLNKPELTRGSFFPDTYGNAHGFRIYKTGDLARYLPNGNIEYQGRIDFQVKLRGFRIELGEIEVALRQQPSVKDSVVIVREDTVGDQRLAAYVVPANDELDTRDLKAILKAKLPEYMVPADIVRLDAFPLTTSGKIDREALPVPTRQCNGETEFFAPRTSYETQMAQIWAELLSLQNPGIHDNFFELGGHSLLATRVIARINRTFGTQLPLRKMFEHPTIAGLAQAALCAQAQKLPNADLAMMLDNIEALLDEEAIQLLAEKSEGKTQ